MLKIHGEVEIKTSREWRDHSKKTRVYVSPTGETVMENFLGGRYNRPHQAYREEIMPAVLEALDLPADTKFFFSQKAGCSCGCSPAFIVEGPRTGREAFVSVYDPRATSPEQIARDREDAAELYALRRQDETVRQAMTGARYDWQLAKLLDGESITVSNYGVKEYETVTL